jgi:hypothetical protein
MVDDDDRLQVLAEHPDTVVVPAPEDPVALGAVGRQWEIWTQARRC